MCFRLENRAFSKVVGFNFLLQILIGHDLLMQKMVNNVILRSFFMVRCTEMRFRLQNRAFSKVVGFHFLLQILIEHDFLMQKMVNMFFKIIFTTASAVVYYQ